MSDGCPHAGIGISYNFGWKREDIISFVESLAPVGYTAKTLSTIIVDECFKLYGGKPGDDATACIVRIRKREPMNILFGPPSNRDDANRMMSLFFSKEGKHIICGGTTSSIASKYLGKPIKASLDFTQSDVPPTAEIEGVDLVTEGVITVNKVVEYANDYLGENKHYEHWSIKRDGASLISRLLFEEATDINFYVGRAINPAHQNPELPINFNIKMSTSKSQSYRNNEESKGEARYLRDDKKRYYLASVDENIQQLINHQKEELTQVLIEAKSEYDKLVRESKIKTATTEELDKKIAMLELVEAKKKKKYDEINETNETMKNVLELKRKKKEEEQYNNKTLVKQIEKLKNDTFLIQKDILDKEVETKRLRKIYDKERAKENDIRERTNNVNFKIQDQNIKNKHEKGEQDLQIEYYKILTPLI